MFRLIGLGLLACLLAGCSLPRGAALQSEILAASKEEFPDLAVYIITKDNLSQYAAWPKTGQRPSHGWLGHAHQAEEPRIAPFDKITLTIWDSEGSSLLTTAASNQAQLSEITVSANGSIFVPYVGLQRVAGRTAESARAAIERQLIEVIPTAQVQLSVLPGTRNSVSLVGGVNAPGPVQLPEGHFTVLNLIAQGGGPNPALRNPQVRLIRNGKPYVTSLARLYESPGNDTILRGGDKVALEADPRYFRALGASGKEQLVYFEKDRISALDAMSLVGGVDDNRADPKGVLVLRQYPSSAVRGDGSGPEFTRAVFTIDLTTADGLFSAAQFQINPQDTVLVTESPVTNTRTIFALLGSGFGLARQLAN